ncbi:hypothetical protein GUJ93_ZPchr0575g29174 [Zizania palustris]|uniref:Uncharacterized protein n=1 Tax=Zizania palustris TaxID=103762 RepID=A0A8J5W6N6_ZIZPA|nr:hypothetical protein GUJ93_ZPchr0575g29174 [Zizania palustris]
MPLGPEEEEEGDAAGPGPAPGGGGPRVLAASASFRLPETARVVRGAPPCVDRRRVAPDAGDITPMLLSYTIEVHYKQVRGSSWRPVRPAVRTFHLSVDTGDHVKFGAMRG